MKAKTTQTANISNKRFIALFVMLLLSSAGMFGQEVKTEVPVATESAADVSAANEQQSQMELVMWFMGSKQTQINATDNTNRISTNGSGKKQFINNGMTPNRILSRVFLKKMISSDSTLA